MRLIPNLSPRALLALLTVAAACLLGVALVAQYGFGLHPCELCMAQRYPYAAIMVIGGLGALFIRSPRLSGMIAWFCCLLLLVDAGIAFYHTGVELGWFPGPSACTSSAKAGETLEEMRREIENAPLVPCNQPMLQVLGISMAGWNAMAASVLFIGTLAVLWRRQHG